MLPMSVGVGATRIISLGQDGSDGAAGEVLSGPVDTTSGTDSPAIDKPGAVKTKSAFGAGAATGPGRVRNAKEVRFGFGTS